MNLKQTEQVVMLAILHRQPDAYGVSIYEELENRLSKAVPIWEPTPTSS